jgi:hypothetical protein
VLGSPAARLGRRAARWLERDARRFGDATRRIGHERDSSTAPRGGSGALRDGWITRRGESTA